MVQTNALSKQVRNSSRDGPLVTDRMSRYGAFWRNRFDRLETLLNRMTNDRTRRPYGVESVVTWTLTATSTGTHLRMEQSGFRPDQQQACQISGR